MKVKQITTVVHTDISGKEILPQKKVFFLLICLHLHLTDQITKKTFVGKKICS